MAKARSDKLFQKNKLHNKQRNSFARKAANKLPRKRFLIVCEGSATEPNYFKALCHDLRLTRNDVKIYGEECGSSPKSVLKFTKEKIDEAEKNETDSYDLAYCVFDKDQHGKSYTETLDAIKRKPTHKVTKIIAINSVPCFEFWILLHFEQTDSPFKNSASVAKRIEKHQKDYNKDKNPLTYSDLKDKRDTAIKNAKAVAKSVDGDNPSTKVHILVEELIKQSKQS